MKAGNKPGLTIDYEPEARLIQRNVQLAKEPGS